MYPYRETEYAKGTFRKGVLTNLSMQERSNLVVLHNRYVSRRGCRARSSLAMTNFKDMRTTVYEPLTMNKL